MIKLVQIYNDNNEPVSEIPFFEGTNYIVAETSSVSNKFDNKKSRNGAGKSSLIEVIDFCFGNDNSNFLSIEKLSDWSFSLSIEIEKKIFKITRILNSKIKDKIFIEDNDFSTWLIKPKKYKDTDKFFLKVKDWRIILGKLYFNIQKDQNETEKLNYYPSFRSLISYFIRNGKDSYLSPFKTFERQKECQIQINNAFLLNLNWEYALKFQKLKDDKKILDQLKAANKAGLLEGYEGKIGKLEAEKISLDKRIIDFTTQIKSFKVHPQYELIQKQSNNYTEDIHSLNNEIIIKNSLLTKYYSCQKEENDIDLNSIKIIYGEAGLVFPETLTKSLEEIIEFHKVIINNRAEYLKNEIQKIENEIIQKNSKIKILTEKRAKNFEILNTHNALDEYTKLSEKLSQLKQNQLELETNIRNLKKIENNATQIKKETLELFENAKLDLEERSNQKILAMSLFLEIANELYDDSLEDIPNSNIGLTIDITDKGYKFDAYIGKDNSDGRSAMKIFDYDFTIMNINAQLKQKQDFLIHDSNIFDPVDERQIANAIIYADKVTKKLQTQYICTINSDRIPYSLFSEEFKIKFDKSIRLRLKDSEDGGLFKMRF